MSFLMNKTLTKDQMKMVMVNDIFKKFVSNVLDNQEPEPFCPFIFSGYCNDAYSERCYHCEHAVKDYLRIDDTV